MSLTQSAPTSLMQGIMRVQNNEPNSTVFSKVVDGNFLKIDFAAKGYPGDIQRCPTSLAQDIDFLNSLENGVLTVISAPDGLLEMLQFETTQIREERAEQQARHADVLDRRQDRDIVGTTCIGPAPTGRDGKCGRSLIQSAKQGKEQPPLCTEHQHLTPNYFLAEAGSKGENATESVDGVVRHEWKTVTMTAPQRQA